MEGERVFVVSVSFVRKFKLYMSDKDKLYIFFRWSLAANVRQETVEARSSELEQGPTEGKGDCVGRSKKLLLIAQHLNS